MKGGKKKEGWYTDKENEKKKTNKQKKNRLGCYNLII